MTQTAAYRRCVRTAGAMNAKAIRLGVFGTVTPLELFHVVNRNCEYCGIWLREDQGTWDHRIPFAKGGLNLFSNIARCCITCNRQKYTKSPDELSWYQGMDTRCIVCGRRYKPRYSEWMAGRGRTCSRSCAARSRWIASS